MNRQNMPGAFSDKIGFILFMAALFVGCQSLQRVDRSDTEYVESMRASETELVWVHHPAGIQCGETYYNNAPRQSMICDCTTLRCSTPLNSV